MGKIYKLLRDNQQTGPYTPEELVQLGLKPFDLIWADGITAGWMYPSEIDIFKPYVAETKKEPIKATEASAAPDRTIASPVSEQEAPPAAAAQQPLSIPSSARHIFISMPASAAKAAPPKKTPVAEPVAEEETPAQKLERKALELRQRVQALAEAKKTEGEEPALDTRYSRSLEDIKEEYTHWMKEQKHKGHGLKLSKKQVLVAALVLVLAGAGYTSISWLQSSSGGKAPAAFSPKEAVLPVKPSTTLQPEEPPTQSVINTDYSERHDRALEDLEWANRKIEKDLERLAAKRNAAAPPSKAKPAVEAHIPKAYAARDAAPAPESGEALKREPSAVPEMHTVAYRTEKKAVPLSQQIDVKAVYLWTSRGKGFSGLELALRNNSVQVLKTVAVDVFYYKDTRLLDKKTVYFNNIQPGESVTLTAPGNRKATSATYQLGLISSEGALYVARQ